MHSNSHLLRPLLFLSYLTTFLPFTLTFSLPLPLDCVPTNTNKPTNLPIVARTCKVTSRSSKACRFTTIALEQILLLSMIIIHSIDLGNKCRKIRHAYNTSHSYTTTQGCFLFTYTNYTRK